MHSIENLGANLRLLAKWTEVLEIPSIVKGNEEKLIRDKQFMKWLYEQDLLDLVEKTEETRKYREEHKDWERPVVMYGVRRMGHKCIKKREIGVIIDKMPYMTRARMAETHWYHIVYKRLATDIEMEWVKDNNRRYKTWKYFIDKSSPIDKIISFIVEKEQNVLKLSVETTNEVVKAFEDYFKRSIRVYSLQKAIQLELNFDPV